MSNYIMYIFEQYNVHLFLYICIAVKLLILEFLTEYLKIKKNTHNFISDAKTYFTNAELITVLSILKKDREK